jgi:hypothetical protein
MDRVGVAVDIFRCQLASSDAGLGHYSEGAMVTTHSLGGLCSSEKTSGVCELAPPEFHCGLTSEVVSSESGKPLQKRPWRARHRQQANKPDCHTGLIEDDWVDGEN